MDADLKPDIAHESADQREKGTRQKVNGRLRHVGKVLIQDPGPPIKDHGDDIGYDALPLVAQIHRCHKKFQPPHQEHGEKREKDITGDDREQPEYAGNVVIRQRPSDGQR